MYTHEYAAIAYDLIHEGRGQNCKSEAERVASDIRQRQPNATSLLDVACGTGCYLEAFVALGFQVTGVEPSPVMLDKAQQRVSSTASLYQGDMRILNLGCQFDAVVCLGSAIGYMTTEEDLTAAIAAMAAHLSDGGVLVVEPWITPENWSTGFLHAYHINNNDIAVARVSLSGRDDSTSTIEMRYAGATIDGTWEFTEHHHMGLFTVDQYIAAFERSGLHVDHDKKGLLGRGLYIGTKRKEHPD